MRLVRNINDHWRFIDSTCPDEFVATPAEGVPVRLPHNAVEIPLDYFDETSWHRRFCYQMDLEWRGDFQDRRVALRFDGVMADAQVYVNGMLAGSHPDGYTPFEVDVTRWLDAGGNLVTLICDGSENPGFPPFGGQIDYLTYAGIYRDAWLIVRDPVSIGTVKIESRNILQDDRSLIVKCKLMGDVGCSGIDIEMHDMSGTLIARTSAPVDGQSAEAEFECPRTLGLWDIDSPTLYKIGARLNHSRYSDQVSVVTGFRKAEFRSDGFFLNDRHIKIRGLNRHQSYPHVGYGMGRRAQEKDAEILKYDLGCNLVRTSHYPQSPWFLNHCDRIGLLVFPEAPGWQHVGGHEWQRQHIDNIRAMITRDWNRPSIVLWGVRVNESQDHKDLYREANETARDLDPTRQTAGVRNFTHSDLLEDVYTMNDFILGNENLPGTNRPRTALRDQQEVTGLNRRVPYIVTEFNGHMYPTARSDHEERQIEHVTRYLEVLDHSQGDSGIAGSIGWCMFDYNTHKDFGSGNRICHHGVLDMNRIPKFASHVYSSQLHPSKRVVMEPVTLWARGERGIGGILPLIILTNCDSVSLQYGDEESVTGEPDRQAYPHLLHPPVIFTHQDFSGGALGGWGQRWQSARLVGYLDGKPVIRRLMVPDPVLENIEIVPDHWQLLASEPDEVRVVVTARDQAGNPMRRLQMAMEITVGGEATLIGPRSRIMEAGQAGFWVRSTGETGKADIEVRTSRFLPQRISLDCISEIERYPSVSMAASS